jgi:hypothetical protein
MTKKLLFSEMIIGTGWLGGQTIVFYGAISVVLAGNQFKVDGT